MQAGGTLRVIAFEFWHARCPSGLGLAEDLICIAGPCGTHHFSLWAALFWTTKRYMSLEMRACLKLNQRVLKETSCPTVTVFKSLGVNVT